MKKTAKKLVCAITAVGMTATMALSAGAYSASCLGQTNKSNSTNRYYISCFETGLVNYGNVSGTAWTKTSKTASIMNPDYKFEGSISVVNSCGSTYANKNAPFSDGVICSINGIAGQNKVYSYHNFNSSAYGTYYGTLSADI